MNIPLKSFIFLLSVVIGVSSFLRPVFAETVYIGPDTEDGVVGAIERSKPGDTIVLKEGEYEGNITIKHPITLVASEGAGKVSIKAKDAKLPTISITSTNSVVIKNLSVYGSERSGIHVLNSERIILNDIYAEGSYYGVYFEGVSESKVMNSIFTDNETGLNIYKSDSNIIGENIISSNNDKGLVIYDSNDNLIFSNTVRSNYWNGITLWAAKRNIIRDNVVVNNTYAIVMNEQGGDNVFENNRTMRRLYFLLPIALIYLGVLFYFIEKKIFYRYYRLWRGRNFSPMETK